MLVEPVSQKQPVTLTPSLMEGCREEVDPMIKPDTKTANTDDGVDEWLKDAPG